MKNKHLTEQQFSNFELPDELMQGIEESGFIHCTPIQAATLPLSLANQDIAGQAQTGTGKTAAFLVALFNRLLTSPISPTRTLKQPLALVIAPTRELAIQIHKDADLLGSKTGFRIGVVYGGTGYEQQKQMVSDGLDVLIGTPGRLIDYFKQHLYDLQACQVMVLDEADRMFDLGFIKDIRYLLRRLPKPEERLSMLFSATLSHRVEELAYEHMNNPERIEVEAEQITSDTVEQAVYYPANNEKIPLLFGLFNQLQPTRTIIFVNTKREADRVWGYLEGNGYPTSILSGDVPQKKRQELLAKFEQGEYPILVATDVAARGLHIPDVSHVVNYDLPQEAEDYVHRIGRTARAGAKGVAISFACEEFAFSLADIEQFIGNRIPMIQVSDEILLKPEKPRIKSPHRPRRDSGPGRGRGQGRGRQGSSNRSGKSRH